MKPPRRPGVILVAAREWRWITRDWLACFLLFGVPVLAFAILVAAFSHPVIRGLHIVVIDRDRTQSSRIVVEALAASPSLKIAWRAEDLVSASRAVRRGDAIAAVHIPANFERDLKAQRRPQLVAFYNQEELGAAGLAAQGLNDALVTATRALGPANEASSAAPRIGTLTVDLVTLVNPERNYAQFLLRSLLPAVLHVVITVAAGYAVGSEFKRRSMRTWMACAGGNPIVALAGKLLPLFAIFAVMMMVVTLIIEGLFGIAFHGDVAMMAAAVALFFVGYLALGALLPLLTRDLASGLSAIAILVSPAYGFAGVGFPVLGMNLFSQVYGALMPLRWYEAILFGQAARGVPVQASAAAFAALALLGVLYIGSALYRLNAVRRDISRDKAVTLMPQLQALPTGLAAALVAEWRRILGNRGAFGVFLVAPMLYGLLYPQPYLSQILRDVPIAVVDSDLNSFSRRVVEALDSGGSTRVALRTTTLEEARRFLDRGEVFGIVGIPPGTHREVLKGNTVALPVYVDATYLFLFKSVATGVSEAIGDVVSGLSAGGARSDGSVARATLAAAAPADILLQPIFNPVGGYASYIVPAAFLLILQQTLVIGAAVVTGFALDASAARPLATIVARAFAHLILYMPALLLYFVVLPRFFGFPALGRPGELLALAAPFILATSLLGQAAGARFRRPETAPILFLGLSLPLFFIVGFAWPREAIPDVVLRAGVIFPSGFAIDGLVRVNQMGASLHEVGRDWAGLWCLVALYLMLAFLSARARLKRVHG